MGWEGEQEVTEALEALRKKPSATTVKGVAQAAIKNIREYKRVVHAIEHYLWKAKPEQRLPAIHCMDAIFHQAKSADRTTYIKRFSLHLRQTMQAALQIPKSHQDSLRRTMREWVRKGYYDDDTFIENGASELIGPENDSEEKKASPLREGGLGAVGTADAGKKINDLLNILKKQKEAAGTAAVTSSNVPTTNMPVAPIGSAEGQSGPRNYQQAVTPTKQQQNLVHAPQPPAWPPAPPSTSGPPVWPHTAHAAGGMQVSAAGPFPPTQAPGHPQPPGAFAASAAQQPFPPSHVGGANVHSQPPPPTTSYAQNSGVPYPPHPRGSYAQTPVPRPGNFPPHMLPMGRGYPPTPSQGSGLYGQLQGPGTYPQHQTGRSYPQHQPTTMDRQTPSSGVYAHNQVPGGGIVHNKPPEQGHLQNEGGSGGAVFSQTQGDRIPTLKTTLPPSAPSMESKRRSTRWGPRSSDADNKSQAAPQNSLPQPSQPPPVTPQPPPLTQAPGHYGPGSNGVGPQVEARPPMNMEQDICRNFQRGSCKFGDRCRYLHLTPGEAPRSPNFRKGMPTSSDGGRPRATGDEALRKTKLCSLFLQGNCQFGQRCNFAHGQEELRRLPSRPPFSRTPSVGPSSSPSPTNWNSGNSAVYNQAYPSSSPSPQNNRQKEAKPDRDAPFQSPYHAYNEHKKPPAPHGPYSGDLNGGVRAPGWYNGDQGPDRERKGNQNGHPAGPVPPPPVITNAGGWRQQHPADRRSPSKPPTQVGSTAVSTSATTPSAGVAKIGQTESKPPVPVPTFLHYDDDEEEDDEDIPIKEEGAPKVTSQQGSTPHGVSAEATPAEGAKDTSDMPSESPTGAGRVKRQRRF